MLTRTRRLALATALACAGLAPGTAMAAPADPPPKSVDDLAPDLRDTPLEAVTGRTAPAPAQQPDARPRVAAAAVTDLTTTLDSTPRTGPRHVASTLRLGGRDVYTVSARTSQRAFPRGARYVYLARSDVPTDALVAGSLTGGPILLTSRTSLPAATSAEISRLGNPHVVVVGGPASVPDAVARKASRGAAYTRIGGRDRFEVARNVARRAFPQGARHVYLADGVGTDGSGAAHAVSAGSLTDGPVLWVDPRRGLDAASQSLLKTWGSPTRHQLGWTSLRTPVADTIGSYDRHGVSVAVAQRQFGVRPRTVYLARSDSHAEALSGGALTDGPVLLSAPTKLPRALCVYLRRSTPGQVVAIGGTGAISQATLDQARACATRGTYTLFSGYTFHPVAEMPYVGKGRPTPNRTCTNTLEPGTALHTRKWNGENVFHPVSLAGQTLVSLMNYEKAPTTAEGCRQLNIARNNAQYFLSHPDRVRVGTADFYRYTFDVAMGGDPNHPLRAPWYSGMAQGHMLSLYSRLYAIDGDPRWKQAAVRAFNSFTVPRSSSGPWVTTTDANGRMWFEEYADSRLAPPLVVNGHVFAIYGMYDYFAISKDPRARVLMDAGASTLRDATAEFRNPGGISSYCTSNPHCQNERWMRSLHYHEVVIEQLEVMARMTGDRSFAAGAAQLRRDRAV